jgi:hypothetical protein
VTAKQTNPKIARNTANSVKISLAVSDPKSFGVASEYRVNNNPVKETRRAKIEFKIGDLFIS